MSECWYRDKFRFVNIGEIRVFALEHLEKQIYSHVPRYRRAADGIGYHVHMQTRATKRIALNPAVGLSNVSPS